jgi:hypothetical protein
MTTKQQYEFLSTRTALLHCGVTRNNGLQGRVLVAQTALGMGLRAVPVTHPDSLLYLLLDSPASQIGKETQHKCKQPANLDYCEEIVHHLRQA